MESRKLLKKIGLALICVIAVVSAIYAFEYIPKNADQDPFAKSTPQINSNNINKPAAEVQKTPKVSPENREITNLNEYFQYLPYAVNRNWTPYKANADYEVSVQFRVHNDGSITDVEIVESTNERANASVLNAVKHGAPYKPLPKSYPSDTVKAQVVLEYHK